MPPELDALICAMLAKDASARPTLAQVRGQLRLSFNQLLVSGPMVSPLPGGALAGHQLTPPGSLGVQATPPPGLLQTPSGPVGLYQTGAPAKPRSRVPMFVIVGLVAGGLGIAVFLGLSGGGGDTKPDVEAPPPVTAPAAVTAPAPDTAPATAPHPKPHPPPTPPPKPRPPPTPHPPPAPTPSPPTPSARPTSRP